MGKIVVVGANHAGTAAINTILNNYPNEQVVVFDSNSNISFLGCGMALWIGGQISGPEGLFYSDKSKMEALGATVYMETAVEEIDYEKKEVTARKKDGSQITEEYDRLILATGSWPVLPKFKGAELENVQLVKLYQHAQEVIEKIKSPEIKTVAVVGAGYIGVELAEAFNRNGKKTTLIDVADTCLAEYYDRDYTDMMNENLQAHGISLAYGERVVELRGNKNVHEVVTDKGIYPADMVVLCVGFVPSTALGGGKLALYKNGAFLVNKKQETSMKDVYAIGDCATVYDNAIGDTSYIALATNAVRSGIIAAHNACGTSLESAGVQGSSGINIYGLKMVATGLTLAKAKKLRIDARATDFSDLQKPEFIEAENAKVSLRIVYDAKTRVVIGAQMASDYDMSMGIHLFSLAIQEKVTVDKLALTDIFFLPHFNKPYNYITMAALSAE